jgi:glycosyltransferase involved in cell wall biosynthesis
MKKKYRNIGILTVPINRAGNIPLSNLVDVLHPISNDMYLITGNEGYRFFKEDKKIYTYGIRHESGVTVFTRILRYIYTQLRISYELGKISKKIDLWIFFIGGDGLILPMLTAKLVRKKVVLASAGSLVQSCKSANDNLSKQIKILVHINRSLSNGIILYSPNLIKEWNLEKYRDKIYIAHKHFVDFDKFKIKKRFDERKNLVGYIGRLSEEKGTLNFVKAIPEIIRRRRDDVKFLIVGDGPLQDKIEEYLDKENLSNKVNLTGWIPHDELPSYLNELELVVLPSYTEGLPNIMLEAMACGTPVLATSVGAIPDVIKDGETGFIMENNSPAFIAKNVERALNHPNLEKIEENARALVERKFTYEAAVGMYKSIINNMEVQ